MQASNIIYVYMAMFSEITKVLMTMMSFCTPCLAGSHGSNVYLINRVGARR